MADSPQYLALEEKIDDVVDVIGASIPEVAPKLQARGLVTRAASSSAINSLAAGQDHAVIARQLMNPVELKVKLSPDTFYDLVDAFNACSLIIPIGKILEEHCSELPRLLHPPNNNMIHIIHFVKIGQIKKKIFWSIFKH